MKTKVLKEMQMENQANMIPSSRFAVLSQLSKKKSSSFQLAKLFLQFAFGSLQVIGSKAFVSFDAITRLLF